jgi:hypothetical protein
MVNGSFEDSKALMMLYNGAVYNLRRQCVVLRGPAVFDYLFPVTKDAGDYLQLSFAIF